MGRSNSKKLIKGGWDWPKFSTVGTSNNVQGNMQNPTPSTPIKPVETKSSNGWFDWLKPATSTTPGTSTPNPLMNNAPKSNPPITPQTGAKPWYKFWGGKSRKANKNKGGKTKKSRK